MSIASLIEVKPNPNIPDLESGDTVKVSAKIVEGGKERIQIFQGIVIRLRRCGAGSNFTVRHVSHGIGVERTFPFYSPRLEKVEVVRHGKVRRAKLYYLRNLSGKAARIKERRVDRKKKPDEDQVQEEVNDQTEDSIQDQEEVLANMQEEIQEEIQGDIQEEPQEKITE